MSTITYSNLFSLHKIFNVSAKYVLIFYKIIFGFTYLSVTAKLKNTLLLIYTYQVTILFEKVL
jgi:hypothetical protein